MESVIILSAVTVAAMVAQVFKLAKKVNLQGK